MSRPHSLYERLKSWKPVWKPIVCVDEYYEKFGLVRAIEGVQCGLRVELRIEGDAALFLRHEGATLEQTFDRTITYLHCFAVITIGVLFILVMLLWYLVNGTVDFTALRAVSFFSVVALITALVTKRMPFEAAGEDEELVVARAEGGIAPECSPPRRKNPIKIVEGSEVVGIQLCECYNYADHTSSGDQSFPAAQMNLLLSSPPGSRVHVATDRNDRRIRRDAQRLADFLDKPIFDHLSQTWQPLGTKTQRAMAGDVPRKDDCGSVADDQT